MGGPARGPGGRRPRRPRARPARRRRRRAAPRGVRAAFRVQETLAVFREGISSFLMVVRHRLAPPRLADDEKGPDKFDGHLGFCASLPRSGMCSSAR